MKRLFLIATLLGCKSELNPAYCAAHPTDTRCTEAGLDASSGSDAGGEA